MVIWRSVSSWQYLSRKSLDVLGEGEEAREAALLECLALGFIGEAAGGFGDFAGDLGFHFGDDGGDGGLGGVS